MNNYFHNIETLLFCGDIHGEFESIVYKLSSYDNSVLIICGDVGMGIKEIGYYLELFKKLNIKLLKHNNNLVFLRGNHDDPTFFNGTFKKYKNIHFIPDYSVISVNEINILCVGGATSIDRKARIELELKTGRKTYWGDAELPYIDNERLIEINESFPDNINIVATHTAPSFAYPTKRGNIKKWIDLDEELDELINLERNTMDKIFAKLKESQNNLSDWYYGHFHEHRFEQHYGINFRLCDCGEINKFMNLKNNT